MSSQFGSRLKLQIFGQSHAPAIGMTLDGFPAGFTPDLDRLQAFLDRRAPGQGAYSTQRKEADRPEFLSGLVEGHTCGAPLSAIIRNTDQRSSDYGQLANIPRPSHGDFTGRIKYGGWEDVRGGGHFSGRLTAPLCIAGGLCLQWLEARQIRIGAHIARIASVQDRLFDPMAPELPLSAMTLEPEAWTQMQEQIAQARQEGDSVGGVIECAVTGLPAGLGGPMFDGVENRLAQILFGIPGIKGVEFGTGFACAALRGSEHNDPFCLDERGTVRTCSNHAGGILGGISSGMPVLFRVAVKPTPSISRVQQSVCLEGTPSLTSLQIKGRHDPCIVPRALPCVEAAAALALMDLILEEHQWN